jgi:hypothetical protein
MCKTKLLPLLTVVLLSIGPARRAEAAGTYEDYYYAYIYTSFGTQLAYYELIYGNSSSYSTYAYVYSYYAEQYNSGAYQLFLGEATNFQSEPAYYTGAGFAELAGIDSSDATMYSYYAYLYSYAAYSVTGDGYAYLATLSNYYGYIFSQAY